MNSFKKNVGQRVVAVILTLLLVVTIIPVQAVSAATQTKATKVTIKNAIEVMNVGTTYTLKSKVSPKSATSKVTYTSSNKKVATVTKDGVIKAKKSGWVTITAKTSNGKKDQCKILVVSKYGYTSLQSKINLMLKADHIKYITINNLEKAATYKIEAGTYKDKTLAVNAPKSDVNNHATFKKIKLVDVKNGTWNEFAKGNNFVITDDEFSFNVKRSASVEKMSIKNTTNATITVTGTVKKLVTSGADSTLNLVVNKEIGTIEVSAKTNLVISGTADKVNVVVKAGAEGTTIKADNADAIQVDNQTKEEILVNGESNSSNDNTNDNNTTPGGTTGGSTGGTTGGTTGGSTSVTTELNGVYANNQTTYTVPSEITMDKVTEVVANAKKNNTTVSYTLAAVELAKVKNYYSLHEEKASLWNNPNWPGTRYENNSGYVKVGELKNGVRTVTSTVVDHGAEYISSADVKLNADSQFEVTVENGMFNSILKNPATIIIDTTNQTVAIQGYDLSDNVTIKVTYTK